MWQEVWLLLGPVSSPQQGSLGSLLTRHTPSVFPQDSLAAEIEGTMRKELQLEEPDSPDITYGCMAFVFHVPTNRLRAGAVHNPAHSDLSQPAVVLPGQVKGDENTADV